MSSTRENELYWGRAFEHGPVTDWNALQLPVNEVDGDVPIVQRHDEAVMFEEVSSVVSQAERVAKGGSIGDVLKVLRKLSLGDFGALMWSFPLPQLPRLSAVLPAMASDETQLSYTGKSGLELCQHTVDFCRIVGWHFQRLTGRSLQGQRVLDFGAGYGRIARLMYWFTDPDCYFGVDPMARSLEVCQTDRLLGTFKKINYVQDEFELDGRRFDLIFAYSVFTHTPEKITNVALRALRRHIKNNGLLVITIRPVEHWLEDVSTSEDERQANMAVHRSRGFAFRDHGYVAEGEPIYGENSMTLEWLAASHPEWEVEGYDRGIDRYQTIVFLTPR